MRKRFFFAAVMLLSVCSLCLISCGDDKDDVKPKDTEVVTPDEEEGKEDCDEDIDGAVDLGLSVKWATCNLGASKPEEFGDYYGWGCVEPYGENDYVDLPFYFKMLGGTGTESKDFGTEKDPLCEYFVNQDRSFSGTKWDAARRKLGGKWRMPTVDEISDLVHNCDWTWTSVNGVNGYIVSNKSDASKYIFIPAAGYRESEAVFSSVGWLGQYWSADPYSCDYVYSACCMFFLDAIHFYGEGDRAEGYPIRPVTD